MADPVRYLHAEDPRQGLQRALEIVAKALERGVRAEAVVIAVVLSPTPEKPGGEVHCFRGGRALDQLGAIRALDAYAVESFMRRGGSPG